MSHESLIERAAITVMEAGHGWCGSCSNQGWGTCTECMTICNDIATNVFNAIARSIWDAGTDAVILLEHSTEDPILGIKPYPYPE